MNKVMSSVIKSSGLVLSAALLGVPALAFANAQSDVVNGAQSLNSGGPTLNAVVSDVINILSVVVGIVAVIMIIVAGFKYVTSGGDSSSISSAKNTLTYAIVGIVIVALAQSIVYFVLDKIK